MPVIYIIGDSTVDDNQPPFRGWGWALPQYVREGVTVKNHALSGCSSRSFREKGLFDPIEKELGEGDLLLIQFGHNDEKDDERHTDPDTTYKAYLWEYCECAYSRGALPVLITPVSRRFFVPPASLLYTHGEYPRAMRELAKEKNVPLCDLKADSRELLETISRVAESRGLVQDVLLEVNIGGELSKSGFAPEEVSAALEYAAALPALRVRGLMAIPPVCAAPEENRPFFLRMQKLFIDNGGKKYDNVSMDFLSMGMSGDYTEAIACGATLVRVGTAIFGARDYSAARSGGA